MNDIPAQVGAYRLVEQLGEGGMGTVWLAEHSLLGRRAAVKLLHPTFSARADIVTRFFNEARAATAISDPGIVQVFDFGHAADGRAYLVMELLEGEPLNRRLQRMQRIPVHDALRIMRQVASSLGAAHARGIVHRDLKPENIYLVRDPEVVGGERAKILDFGIAKLGMHTGGAFKTDLHALMGTPAYMSPEQCRGAGEVDARSDIYSLGCVLHQLVTGRPPFVSDGAGTMIVLHVQQPPALASSYAPHVPAAVDALIARCLTKTPDGRYATGAELAAAIGGVVSGSSYTTLGGAAAQTASLARAAPRRRMMIVPVAVVALAAGVWLLRPSASPAVHDDANVAAAVPEAAIVVSPTPPASIPLPSAPAPDAPTTVSITIATTPPQAQIFVGAETTPRGMTPFTLVVDAHARFDVRVVRAGFRTKRITIDPPIDRDVAITLVKLTGRPAPATPSGGDPDDIENPFANQKGTP